MFEKIKIAHPPESSITATLFKMIVSLKNNLTYPVPIKDKIEHTINHFAS